MTASWRADWLATLVQGLPQLLALRRHMVPTLQSENIASVDPALIRSHGVSALIWDVDGTLMRRHGTSVAPQLAAAFCRLCADNRLRHAILSNCSETRFVELSTIFPAIPILRFYESPAGIVARRRLGADEYWSDAGGEASARGGRVLRKPNVAMVLGTLMELGCRSPAEAMMIGDQYLTDIAPANMAGVRTLKVKTIEPDSFPETVRVLQWLEQVLYTVSGA